MSTTSRDFTDNAVNTENTADGQTNITGFTFKTPEPWNWNTIIDADNDFVSDRRVRFYDSIGSGGAPSYLYETTDIGNLGASVVTDVLVQFRVPASVYTNDAQYIALVRANGLTTTPTMAALIFNAAVDSIGLADMRANSRWDWIGSPQTISGMAANEIWWARIQVNGSDQFSWRVWEDGTSEPGTWQQSGLTWTVSQSGYVGIGGANNTALPIHWGWFSIGTAGDPAPEPAGGGPSGSPLYAYMQQ